MKYKRYIKRAVTFIFLGVSAVIFVLAGQIGQAVVSGKDARMHTISLWNKKNVDNKYVSQLFIDQCLTSRKLEHHEVKVAIKNGKKIVDIYECGDSLGAQELIAAIKETDKAMRSFAWPLSIFAQE